MQGDNLHHGWGYAYPVRVSGSFNFGTLFLTGYTQDWCQHKLEIGKRMSTQIGNW